MDVAEDSERVAASLTDRLDLLTFADLSTDAVTERIIDTVADWADDQGWRVYRRAPSVLPLPPPMTHRHSVLDVACARPDGPPVVIEIDRTDRGRTVEKLLAEADAGRIPIWVRWGTGPFTAAAAPVRMVTCEVAHRSGPVGHGRLHTRAAAVDRPAPAHSATVTGPANTVTLPLL